MAAHHHHEPPPPPRCPRCDSSSTKFCYYNSYDLSQPRYFCKDCRRYWTQREVPPAVRPRRLRITISDTETSSSPHDSLNLQDPERNIRSFVIVGGSTVKAKTGVNRRWETGTSILCPMDNQQQKYELPTNVGPEYRDGYVYNSFGGEASTKRHHPYVPQVHIDILRGKDQIDTETSSSPHDSLNPQGKPEPDTSLRNQNRYNSFGGGKDPIDVEKGNNGQTDLVFDQAPNDYRNQLKNSKFNDDATKIVSGIRDFPLVDMDTGQLHCCPSGYVDDDILTRTDPFSVRSDPWSVNNRWETHASISGSMDNHQQQRYALPSNVGPEHMNGYGYNSSGGETSTTRHHSYAPQVHIDIFNGNGEIDGDLPLPAFRYHRVARLPEKNFDVDLPNYEIIDFHPIWKVLTSSTTVEIIKHLPKGSFTKRGRKFRSILRPNRVAGSGFWKATGIDMPIRASNVKTGRAKNRRQTHTSILDSMIYQQWQQYALPSNVGPEHMNGYGYNSSGGETSTTRDHSYVPQVHIDIIDEINQIMAENGNNGRTYLAIYQAWNEYKNRLKNSKFDDDAMNIMSGIFVAVAGQFVAGVMANRLTSSASSSSWAAPIVELATVFGLCVTLLGISLRAKSRSLSTLMIKIGAVTTAWAIIFSMGSHIPPAMAWTVGPVAFLIMAVAAAFA